MEKWFIDYMRKHKTISDERQELTEEQLDYFFDISNKVFTYARNNFIPYDLEEDDDCFLQKGAIVECEDLFLLFEELSGQGTITMCSVARDEDLLRISNLINIEDLKWNRRHSRYFEYRNLKYKEKIKFVLSFEKFEKEEVSEIFSYILDTWEYDEFN